MINQELSDYIKQQLQRGLGKEEIKKPLLAKGWQPRDIEINFAAVLYPENQPNQPSSNILSKSSLSKPKSRVITILIMVLFLLMLPLIYSLTNYLFIK